MKFSTPIMLAPLLSLCMASAMAAPAADLKVAGKVNATACAFDPGSIADLDLAFEFRSGIPDTLFVLNESAKTFVPIVVCDGFTSVALKLIDNAQDGKPNFPISFDFSIGLVTYRVPPDNYSGLVNAETGESIGAFSVVHKQTGVDGFYFTFLANSSNGKDWDMASVAREGALNSSRAPYIMASTKKHDPFPAPGRIFEFPMTIAATLIKDKVPPSADYSVRGSMTLELSML